MRACPLECKARYHFHPLLHPSRLYTMWKDWHPGIVYEKNSFFYSDWTLEDVEYYIDEIFNTGMFDYYERFDNK